MTDAQATRELLGHTCPSCGKAKRPGRSVCRRCYFKLPQEVRTRLYTHVRDGYTAIYEDALERLRKLSQPRLPL